LNYPATIFGVAVLVIWGREGFKSWQTPRHKRSPMDWLLMGICLGFIGMLFNGFYNGISNSITYLNNDDRLREALDYYGLYFNILFRQICGTLASYCHVKAYIDMKHEKGNVFFLWLLSVLLGLMYVIILYLIKN
jgi:hypothetical protein